LQLTNLRESSVVSQQSAKLCGQKEKQLKLSERINSYERGELDANNIVSLFQELIDSGLAWNLQGHYSRTAYALIEAELCKA
jgi:hypothetical protein